MKLKVLSIGDKVLYHEGIQRASFAQANVLMDYDAVVIDPVVTSELWREIEPERDGSLETDCQYDGGFGLKILSMRERRKRESTALLENGGSIFCYLRSWGRPLRVRLQHYDKSQDIIVNRYAWLPDHVAGWLMAVLQDGTGKRFRLKGRAHPCATLFEQFADNVSFEAYIDGSGTGDIDVIAETRGGDPIACEYSVGSGKIVFLPIFERIEPKSEASLMLQCIERCLGAPVQAEPPVWLSAYSVPGEDMHAERIADLHAQIAHLSEERKWLQAEQEGAKQFRELLYERGKYRLEPVVRKALRVLGFNVPEPDEYKEDWDAVLCSSEGKAIAEIEGTEGPVDVKKYRQLLDYVSAEAEKGEIYKGILIGNGYCLKEPQSRDMQFTGHALNGCKSQRYCALPTTELFRAVCAVLNKPVDEDLQRHIRLSILATVGLYNSDEALASAGAAISKNGVTP